MKTKKTIYTILLAVLAVAVFFSCENPISLGTKLDLDGPVVNITSPTPRKSVPNTFEIEGTIYDYSGVKRLIIKVVNNNEDFPRQWRYQNGAWEVSEDFGASWQPFADAQWTEDGKNVNWKINVNMMINGQKADDGEYTFNVQAWDKGEISGDKSNNALVLIVDQNPPKVDVTYPFIYRGNNPAAYTVPPLLQLDTIPDTGTLIPKELKEYEDPSYLGKFITQQFELKWQIDDINEIQSFDIRFYDKSVYIDNKPETELPDGYIYSYQQELPPVVSSSQDYIKLNGSVNIPSLDSLPGTYNGGELKTPISDKTTIKVVVKCKDTAGNPNQEKTLGYFVYWPRANNPWIVFSDGMNDVSTYTNGSPVGNNTASTIDPLVFMVYPSSTIRATAFQAHGVKEVKYSVYECKTTGNTLDMNTITLSSQGTEPNEAGTLIFPWKIPSPVLTGYYILEATAYGISGNASQTYRRLFRVQDITFPGFPNSPSPPASDPLFNAVTSGSFTISGTVDDATEISSLCMVWINPDSEDYAAMSQLRFFRDEKYSGWKTAEDLPNSGGTTEQYDTALGGTAATANRVWKIPVTGRSYNPQTNRYVYNYSQSINLLNHMKINLETHKNPLTSQMFLLRAKNPDGKCTIITYAPQGDTSAPSIKITDVVIKGQKYTSEQNTPLPKLDTNDTITINGTWDEDSASKLPIATYFKPNFKLTVSKKPVTENITMYQSGSATSGMWTVDVKVGGSVVKEDLLDTLAINATASDVGGNVFETTASWVIQSDNIKLMRISSDLDDGTYSFNNVPAANKKIEIFLEFNKPVRLNKPTSDYNSNPQELILNVTGVGTVIAKYKNGQNIQNSRQVFEYEIKNTDNTPTGQNLNVIGLSYNGTQITGTGSGDNNNDGSSNYPFTWVCGSDKDREEIRLTMRQNKNGVDKESGGYYLRTLPTTNSADTQYTLAAGKSIKIDNIPPTVTKISAITNQGYYRTGDIYMKATFSKPVKISGIPQLLLNVENTTQATLAWTTSNANDVRVNGDTIEFKYTIRSDDTTNGSSIIVTSYQGTIEDLAGNRLAYTNQTNNAVTTMSDTNKTLTNVIIETKAPTSPDISVLTANNTSSVLINNVYNVNIRATTEDAGGVKNLANIYRDKSEKLWLVIKSNDSASYKLDHFEYSTNNGTSWLTVPAGDNNKPFEITQVGQYQLKVKQVDKAGNESNIKDNINFTWDPGYLLDRISSTSANGTYTQNSGEIEIDLYFRKNLTFTEPSITLNAQGIDNKYIVLNNATPGTTNKLTFKYKVSNGDHLTGNLAIQGISLPNPKDDAQVNVSNYIGTKALDSSKLFKVETGDLTNETPVFVDESGDGIKDDGSYWTTLKIVFNHEISKGEGSIKIKQIKGSGDTSGYRLPTVLTEAQYNRFKGVANIDKYYTKGTNGYDTTNNKSDTSTKYILQYSYTAYGSNVPTAPFSEDFRDAEAISINVNAQAVTIDGNTLKIRLSGSNAPQVPGAKYEVTYDTGLVIDSLGNSSKKGEYTEEKNNVVSLSKVAKPFVRIKKTPDTMLANTSPSMIQPRLVATQPLTAEGRIDCRTPGSNITYSTNSNSYSASNNNWSATGGPSDNDTIISQPGNPADTYTNNATLTIGSGSTINNVQGYQWRIRAVAKDAGNANTSTETQEIAYRTVITYQLRGENSSNMIGGADYSLPESGDQIWIRGGDDIGSSSVPGFPFTWEEDWSNLKGKRAGIRLMTLVETVSSPIKIRRSSTTSTTFNTRNNSGSATADSATQDYLLGEVGTIVRFTYNNNTYYAKVTDVHDFTIHTDAACTSAAQTMNITNTNTNTIYVNSFLNSVWRLVTWDINTTAKIDFIRGRDTDSSANVAWQYGPKFLAYQRAGWTSFKDSFRVFPGKHRWCDTGQDFQNKGNVNFSGTFHSRSDYTANDGWTNANNTNAMPQ